MTSEPKVALVYDWVTTKHGGAEKVVQALHKAFPSAPLFTAVADLTAAQWATDVTIHTSFLQSIPGIKKSYRWWSWLMPLAFESFELSKFDIIISVTSAEAKGVLTKPEQLHLCYLLTPTRYLYSHQPEYLAQLPWLFRPAVKLALKYLLWWDQAAAQRPDLLLPISKVVAKRAATYYKRQALSPLYPPVSIRQAVTQNLPHNLPAHYAVVISRLVHYKRIDLAIKACEALNYPLVVIGDGSQKAELEKSVTKPDLIYFLGSQPDDLTQTVLAKSQVLLMPGIEDFGITALEAVCSQVPAVVHQDSGVAEVLTNHQDSVFLKDLELGTLTQAITQALSLEVSKKLATQKIEKYATTTFAGNFRNLVLAEWRASLKKGRNEHS